MTTKERHKRWKAYAPGRSEGDLTEYVVTAVSRIWRVCVFAASFSFHRRRKHVISLPVVHVSAYMFTQQKLTGSQFFAHASLCDGKARGEADSLGTGLSVFS